MEATADDILDWICEYLSEGLEIPLDEVDINKTFLDYGFESSAAVSMVSGLEEWLGLEIEPTILFDYPTPETLSQFIATL